MSIGAWIFSIVIMGLGFLVFYKEIASFFDQTKWIKEAKPDLFSRLQCHDVERVVYTNRRAPKLKTSIYFTDGFIYISHKASYSGFAHYTATVNADILNELYAKAIRAHAKAVCKKQQLHSIPEDKIREFLVDQAPSERKDRLMLELRNISGEKLLERCALRKEVAPPPPKFVKPVYDEPDTFWTCSYCQTRNKDKYSICKKCAKYRSSS